MTTKRYFFLLSLALTQSTNGFSVIPTKATMSRLPTALFDVWYPETFDRAVYCANALGMCDVNEMMELADELEQFQGCFFEENAHDCEKEKMDRQDVAELLSLEAEVMLRRDYFEKANLFKHDVETNERKQNFEQHMKDLDAYSNY